jgi:glycosyltransferase involved in cell wall biosynthesis
MNRINILYLSTVFPRAQESPTIFTDIAEALRDRGHHVVVAAADGSPGLARTQLAIERNIEVLRIKTISYYDVTLFRKGVATLAIMGTVTRAIKRHLSHMTFDIVLFESPPVTMCSAARWAMQHFECPSYLMLKDIFPQNGVDIGLLRQRGFIYKYFKQLEHHLYNTATIIGCMSPANKHYIIRHNEDLNPEKVEVFPNTKKITYTGTNLPTGEFRRTHGIDATAILAVFGGNMGKPQGIPALMDTISLCADYTALYFLLVGRGSEKAYVKRRIIQNSLNNVIVLDALPRDAYERLLLECNLGLIFLDHRFTIPNYPSRVLSYFEYYLPVVAATDLSTDFRQMLEQSGAGLWAHAADIAKIKQNIITLAEDKNLRETMGNNGRRYLEQHCHIGRSVDLIEHAYRCKLHTEKSRRQT